jgi:hypothetical protein
MPYREGDATHTFEGKIETATAKAYLVIPTMGPQQIWVPKSQTVGMSDPDGDGNIQFTVTFWWASHSDMADYIV